MMEALTYTWPDLDKAEWGDGPWLTEPDKIQFEAHGLPCLIRRHPRHGNLCGYVGVHPGHPLYGRGGVNADLDVHGGVTFVGSCDEAEPQDRAICHVPRPGEPDETWWFGFDCGHAWDVMPGVDATMQKYGHTPIIDRYTTYKTVGFVTSECESLAKQLAELGRITT